MLQLFSKKQEVLLDESQIKKLIILNNSLPKNDLFSTTSGAFTGRCGTLNCNGSGNTREGFHSHTSSKYCPLNNSQPQLINSNVRVQQEKNSSTEKAYSELIIQNHELQSKLRILENEKHLGNVIYNSILLKYIKKKIIITNIK